MQSLRILFFLLVIYFLSICSVSSQELSLETYSLPAPIAYGAEPIIDEGNMIYLSIDNKLISLSQDTMNIRWSADISGQISRPLRLIATKKHIIFITNNGDIYFFNKSNGQLLRQESTGYLGSSKPFVYNKGSLVYLFSGSMVYVIKDKMNQESVKESRPDVPIHINPVIPFDVPLSSPKSVTIQ